VAQDRTEEATPRKRQQARQRGQVARSQEVNTALVLLVGLVMMRVWGGRLVEGLGETMVAWLETAARDDLTRADAMQLGIEVGFRYLSLVLPVVGAVLVTGAGASVLQTGFLVSAHPLKPDLSRISPLSGAKRLLSRRGLIDLVRSVGKIALIGTIFWVTLTDQIDTIAALPLAEIQAAWSMVAQLAFDVAIRAIILLLVIAAFDFWWQRRVHGRELRMSTQEVKRERKDMEGDPLLRSQQRQREMASRRMMQEVPEADVVITNPVHFACALAYDTDEMHAPVLLAKGERLIAERIVAIAREHRVPIVPNPPLARTLFRSVEVGDEIPLTLYQAVAQVLAFVHRMRRSGVAV
jgi:flagellar biosynthetic protein FlhB